MGLKIVYHRTRPVASNGQLGDLAGARSVRLSGVTYVSFLFRDMSEGTFATWLRTALENAGFYVSSPVKVRWEGGILGLWGEPKLTVEIDIEVYNNYTSVQAARNAEAAIQAYTANYGLNQPFYNTSLNVAFDGYVAAPVMPTGNATFPKSPSASAPKALPPSGLSTPGTGDKSSISILDTKFDLSSIGLGVVGGGVLILGVIAFIAIKD